MHPSTQPRHRDGRFAPEARAEAHIDLAVLSQETTTDPAPRPEWPASYWEQYPVAAEYRELPSLVSADDPFANATGDTWTKAQRAVLVRSYDLSRASAPTTPAEFADALDWDEDEMEDRDAEEAMYVELADVLLDEPWTVPPILVVEHADGRADILDGNHRAGLSLHLGISAHPAYVLTEPAGADCETCQARARFANG